MSKPLAVDLSARAGAPKPKAVAFVDYEHWLFSLQNQYHMKPDPFRWANNLKDNYELNDIRFYGDFSQEAMSRELTRIRQVSNQVIETKNSSENYRKDFTDFIMLDAIYQTAIFSKDIDVFILFTGDGHFNSVTSFLKNNLQKSVLVYGVKNSFSNTLKAASSSWFEIPADNDIFLNCYQLILQYIAYIDSKSNGFRPTFWNAVHSVAEYNQLDENLVNASLSQLIEQGYISEKIETIKFQKQLKVLIVDWEKAIRDNLWDPNT
ncbi:hypothetical protein A7X67_00085 [Clostridium sp. W14A]|nr:hypothetical protein A7X67_00085 [Clostridium sp. W14A]